MAQTLQTINLDEETKKIVKKLKEDGYNISKYVCILLKKANTNK